MNAPHRLMLAVVAAAGALVAVGAALCSHGDDLGGRTVMAAATSCLVLAGLVLSEQRR